MGRSYPNIIQGTFITKNNLGEGALVKVLKAHAYKIFQELQTKSSSQKVGLKLILNTLLIITVIVTKQYQKIKLRTKKQKGYLDRFCLIPKVK